MGLDMYLEKRKKGSESYDDYEEVAYWRKANQVRGWFAEKVGVENCEYSVVTKEVLENLVEDCKKVLDNHNRASIVMPTQSGFFFGSTDYDEWYFEDLVQTVEMVTKVIAETDWETEEVAYTEWW
jgi:hypothetical protein